MYIFITKNINETKNIINKNIFPIIQNKNNNIIICLNGPVGAGKTFISKNIISKFDFNIKDIISPTYCIMHQYQNKNYNIYHFDMYRIYDLNVLNDNIDFFNYINSNSIIFIEWASNNIKDYILKYSNKYLLEINIDFYKYYQRKIIIKGGINNQ